ncbi:MAG: response regulator, partial [Armatimonadetes bacterium]|nr:response regulator [Anaerolineae bacterium]
LDTLMGEATELLVARMHAEAQQRSLADVRRMHAKWAREWRSVRAAYIRLMRRVQAQQEQISPELGMMLKFLELNQRYLTESSRRLTVLAQTMTQDTLHLTALSDQLQDDISAMRLVPFETIASGFQRAIRDLARELGKQVQFELNGATVEIDKTVLETLKDPMMHLLRNAVDHGIGTPSERDLAGKPAVGQIRIGVEQRGGEIVITVSDDGRGIDLQRVRRAIVRQKLLSEPEAQALNDEEAQFYIFHPGLSTTERVTAVSGRGIGMDVVRDRVEGLRGRISIRSLPGEGTSITLHVPVSLTRIRCILLQVGEQVLALPAAAVRRMQTLPRDAIFTAEGQALLMMDGQAVPCVTLGALLAIPSSVYVEDTAQIVLVQAANRLIAFEVDALLNDQELVLKPLGRELAGARYISGAALTATGEVVMVLNANDLVRGATGTALPRRAAPTVVTPIQQTLRVLVVDDSITTRTLEKNILETAGFETSVAIDGLEAWALLHEREFDVLISDVEMPRMNGLELTSLLRQDAKLRDMPVILLTSLAKPEQREAGLRAGADAYLVKSQFDQGELLRTIQSVL